MKVSFDINGADIVEFGVGVEAGEAEQFALVPVQAAVKPVLKQMAIATRDEMQETRPNAIAYEPSERYESHEHLYVALGDENATIFRNIHTANNVGTDAKALANPDDAFCYFARFRRGSHHLTAVRRATSFKSIRKSSLLQFLDDSFRLVEEETFKLDQDFDVLIDDSNVYILRPAGFEFVGQLEKAISNAVPKNVKSVKTDLPFVDFAGIEAYAIKHTRAARYLASIRSQKLAHNVDKAYLKKQCKSTGVQIQEANGKIVVDPASILDFLGVLDRRLYEVELVKGSPESFRAASRSRI
jgi:hypothetical protein